MKMRKMHAVLMMGLLAAAAVCQTAAGDGSLEVTAGFFESAIRFFPAPGEPEQDSCLQVGVNPDEFFREFAGAGPHSVAECSANGARLQLTTELTSTTVLNGTQFTVRFDGEARVVSPPAPPAGIRVTVSAQWDLLLSITKPTAYELGATPGLVVEAGILGRLKPGEPDTLQRSGTLPPGDYVIFLEGAAVDFNPNNFFDKHSVADDAFTITLLDEPPLQFVWVGPTGGTYSEPTNWDPEEDAPPTHDGQSGDTAIFGPVVDDDGDEVTAYSVSANGATASRFIVDRAAVNLDGVAEVFGTSSVEPSLTIIRGGNLMLEDGARLSGINASVGFSPNVPGTVAGLLISGSDCNLTGRLIVGEFSDGDLFIDSAGTLSCVQAIVGDIATGTASISGADSRWDTDTLTVGAVSAAGTLEVLESGRVEVINQVVVGERNAGTVRLIDGGKVVAGEVVLGKETGGDGAIELSGDSGDESSTLEVTGALRVGVAGDGVLRISDGASMAADELHFAPIDLGNAQESRLFIGGKNSEGIPSSLAVFKACSLGAGRLQVLEGAQANFGANLSLGADGTTDVTVAGVGDTGKPARLVTSRLTVGFDKFATLKVQTGGQVTCSELAVSSLDTGGTGRIVVTGGGVTVNGTMRVSGDSRQGENSVIIESDGIEADGSIAANALRLGDQGTSDSAEIVVRNGTPGGGSTLVIRNGEANGECSIGKDGPGVLRLEKNASALATGLARVGASPSGGTGLVEIGVDCRFVAHDLDVGGASPGTIKLLTATSELIVTSIAVVNAGGRIEGVGTFTGARIRNPGGHIDVGLSPGTLTIDADYEQGEDGTLIIEVAGLEPGQFDVLHVTGDAELAGQVDLRFLDGFVPQPGDAFDFVVVDGTITGILRGDQRIEIPPSPNGGGGDGGGDGGDGGGDNDNADDPDDPPSGNDNEGDPDNPPPAENANDNVGEPPANDNADGDEPDEAPPPGNESPDEPKAIVGVVWEVTPEGTCRVTVTDVQYVAPQDEPADRPTAAACGTGACGSGAAPTALLMFMGLGLIRRASRRTVSRRRR